MFLHTQAALNKIATDLKRLSFILNIIAPTITIAYLIYACIAGVGIIYINIALAALSAASIAVYYIFREKKDKKKLRVSKSIIRRLKLLTKAFSLGIAVYGIHLANENTNVFTLVFTSINIIAWMLQVGAEVITTYVTAQIKLIGEGLKADYEGVIDTVKKPINAVGDFIKKVSGKDAEDEPEKEKEPQSKTRRFLEKRVQKLIEEKHRKKEEKKLKKQQEKVD